MIIWIESETISLQVLEAGWALITAFFPKADVKSRVNASGEHQDEVDAAASATLCLEATPFNFALQGTWMANGPWPAAVKRSDVVSLTIDEIKVILAQPDLGREDHQKLLVKHGLNKLLSSVCGAPLPWGILTGIRPSKLLHRLDDLGVEDACQGEVLQHRYGIRKDKIQLLQDIVTIQRPFLYDIQRKPRRVALYVGIPFCPSRCTYCSFPAYHLDSKRQDLQEYLQALHEEIKDVGQMMASFALEADTLYIGGGTPTTLTPDELERLILQLKSHLPIPENAEFTVEAGRPDSLTRAKLDTLKAGGVTRLSINPQSMHNRTLQRIGRAHRVEDIQEMYAIARALSDWLINMDMILGLPGEDIHDVRTTLEQIGKLQPDNLTVHALALKRGSKEHETGYQVADALCMEEMAAVTQQMALQWGLRPYYLYRQKHIAGNLENIGYAKPGAECRYNIGIMEERQSVIGMGAGASSKVVNPNDYTLINLQHPSHWKTYVSRWREGQVKRALCFEAIFKE